jgi:predicted protein tyrosine phosphatase
MPWIQNVPLANIPLGHHVAVGENSMLIQIVDPAMTFPKPKHTFKEVHQFEFLDLEDSDDTINEEFKITDEQAAQLVALLKRAFDKRMDVIVHCHAGICRSGAVAEIGVMMGFQDAEAFRAPNLRVKHKMMQQLGWTYDADEKPSNNWQAYYDYLENKGEI